jgi:hypothetical protein
MKTKTKRFQMRLTDDDKATIEELAEKLQRNESDAFRLAARTILQVLKSEAAAANQPTQSQS